MVKAQTNDQETPIRKIKKRNFIDPQLKLGLINSVVIDHLPIYQAAILHKIKYSSAKHIVRNYLSDTDNFLSRQKKRSRKIIQNNLKVIIDVNSGKIKMVKSTQTNLPTIQQQNNNKSILNNILSELSYNLFKEINKSLNNQIKNKQQQQQQFPFVNLSFEQQLSKIMTMLQLQHEQMNSI